MINMQAEFSKMADVSEAINTISVTVKSERHINELIKSADSILQNEFVIHMASEALRQPKKFSHMYDWGQLGDPNGKLWKTKLKGRGAKRMSVFEFKASKKTVPVSQTLRNLGVKQNHVFYWKAPVLEYGLPVRIYPKLAQILVFEYRGKVVFRRGMVSIGRQGNTLSWNAFTNEYNDWFSNRSHEVLENQLLKKSASTIKNSLYQKIKKIATSRKKTFEIKPIGVDPEFGRVLQESLTKDYIGVASNRRVIIDD